MILDLPSRIVCCRMGLWLRRDSSLCLPHGLWVELNRKSAISHPSPLYAYSLWKNCNEFRPERFIEDPKPSPFIFTAFQAGPRICLGQNMAILGV